MGLGRKIDESNVMNLEVNWDGFWAVRVVHICQKGVFNTGDDNELSKI